MAPTDIFLWRLPICFISSLISIRLSWDPKNFPINEFSKGVNSHSTSSYVKAITRVPSTKVKAYCGYKWMNFGIRSA